MIASSRVCESQTQRAVTLNDHCLHLNPNPLTVSPILSVTSRLVCFLLNFLIVPELKITINPGASLSLAVCCYSNEIIMINTFELVIKRNEGHFDKKTNCLSKGTILFRTVTWRGERATAICGAAEAECVWQGKRQALSTHFIHANEVLNGKIYSLF